MGCVIGTNDSSREYPPTASSRGRKMGGPAAANPRRRRLRTPRTKRGGPGRRTGRDRDSGLGRLAL